MKESGREENEFLVSHKREEKVMLDEAIDRTKVVFVYLNSGAFVLENGFGHELYNFKEDNGKYYGYTPPYGKINLKQISNDIQSDSYGEYIDNVLVIFSTKGTHGRIISGFYQNSRVYSNPIENTMPNRFYDNQYIDYNLICSVDKGYKISGAERSYFLPRATTKSTPGYGRHQVWYANQSKDKEEREKAIDYVIDCIAEVNHFNATNDERKYDESKRGTTMLDVMKRSREARQDCINHHGKACKICGFDFEKTYGDLGKEFIEVHHIESITTLSRHDKYAGTDPIKDLIPVCSNCHSMLHRKRPAYTPENIKSNLKKKSW